MCLLEGMLPGIKEQLGHEFTSMAPAWLVSMAQESFLQSDVHRVYSTCNAFLAIRYDGSIVTWGGRRSGGSAASVSGQLQVAGVTPKPASGEMLRGQRGATCERSVEWLIKHGQWLMTHLYAPPAHTHTDIVSV